MKSMKVKTQTKQLLADIITPVSIYLKIRDEFPNAILLESSDYHGVENSYSFICLQSAATFIANDFKIEIKNPNNETERYAISDKNIVSQKLDEFIKQFEITPNDKNIKIPNGIFGYSSYDAVQYFEDLKFKTPTQEAYKIPDLRYDFFKYIIAINHHKNDLTIIENVFENEDSQIEKIESLLYNRNFATYDFDTLDAEQTNMTDEDYMKIVEHGKYHCFRGDVFQIVLSRQFSQKFRGDDFNVYRALRSINPSPYLFYFDYGSYKIFGSSPEAQLEIKKEKAYINPIAGTFRRTGDDEKDEQLAKELAKDPKENAEHVMLVDLARNDLSRNSDNVKVETYREIQFYSHVLHMVSKVSGELTPDTNIIKVMADTFPAGTLSGAPKYKAMELINQYENQGRGYYGGCIGYIDFNGNFNQTIMIRSFLSKNNTLFFQAGAGIVSKSVKENELKEVNNKLAALKKALIMAKTI